MGLTFSTETMNPNLKRGFRGHAHERQFTPRKPRPTISELLTIVMKALGSCARTKRRSFKASRRESTLVRMVWRLPEYAPQPKVTVAVLPSFLTMNSSTSRG